jgi:lipoprotein-anchoring transpeptidase ErfK/SrfK
MDARFAARMATGLGLAILGLMGLRGEAFAQYPQYYPPGPYPPGPPTYRAAPLPPNDNDDDIAQPPAPRPYGRPSNAPYGAPSGIQSEALPPPGPSPYGGSAYPDASPPPGRGYRYGNWEPVRPPGDVYGPGSLPPGPGRPSDYANTPPMEITPNAGSPPGSGYAALPPDYQPEVGQPREVPPQFRRQMVDYPTREPAGTIVIDTPNTYLYLVLGGGKAVRYGIGVGREGFTWAGREKISRMSEWPDWHPPKEMIDRQPYLPRFMAGGESNPLGARALYLGNTLYRIHGTNQPSTIGSFVSSGCIRLTNGDIEDLYSRVNVGTRVVVLPGGSARQSVRADTTGSAR